MDTKHGRGQTSVTLFLVGENAKEDKNKYLQSYAHKFLAFKKNCYKSEK